MNLRKYSKVSVYFWVTKLLCKEKIFMHFYEEDSVVGYLHRKGAQRRLYNRMRRQINKTGCRCVSATNVAAVKQ
jgi:hypothetical protein